MTYGVSLGGVDITDYTLPSLLMAGTVTTVSMTNYTTYGGYTFPWTDNIARVPIPISFTTGMTFFVAVKSATPVCWFIRSGQFIGQTTGTYIIEFSAYGSTAPVVVDYRVFVDPTKQPAGDTFGAVVKSTTGVVTARLDRPVLTLASSHIVPVAAYGTPVSLGVQGNFVTVPRSSFLITVGPSGGVYVVTSVAKMGTAGSCAGNIGTWVAIAQTVYGAPYVFNANAVADFNAISLV